MEATSIERYRGDRGEDKKTLVMLAEDKAMHPEKNESYKCQKLKRK